MLYGRYYGVPAALTAATEPSMKNSLPCFLSLCAAMLFTAALLRAFKERADATPARHRMPLTIPTLRCARAATRRASRSHNDITYAAGDKFSLVYQKSANFKYWQDVAITIVFTLTGYDI